MDLSFGYRRSRFVGRLITAVALPAAILAPMCITESAGAVAPIVDPLIEPVLDLALLPGAPDPVECPAGEGWYGPPGQCKYAKAKLETTCHNNCQSVDIDAVKWRGGTYTGSCDTSEIPNDVTKWRILWIKIIRSTDNSVRWSRGAGAWHTNCDVNDVTYSEAPGLTVGVDHIVKYKWEHVSASSGPFYPRVDLHVSLPR
jgi:hypothetical protein